MAGTVMPAPKFIGLDNNANPVSGGKLYTYVAGTTTPQATYSDVNLTVANANPVVLDSAGRATVFLSGSSYKFVLKDSDDVTIWTQDNVQAVAPFSTNLDIQGVAGEAILAGQACYLSDGSGALTAGRWYLADADNAYSSSLPQVAMAPDAIDAGETGTFRLQGAVTKSNAQADFVVGDTYYVSATAGLLSLSPGTNIRVMGQADSTTTIVISPNPPNIAATPTFIDGITVTSTDAGAAAAPYLDLYRESASPAASDQIGEVRLSGRDSAGNKQLYARIYGQIADTTSTSEDGQVRVSVVSNGTETLMLVLTESGAFLPDLTTQDLGSGAKPWRNIFLSGTGKLDFGNGDVTVTASANTLTWAGASSGYIFNDGNLVIGATAKFYLDGGNDSYIEEVSANNVRIVAAGNERLRAVGSNGVQITGALTVPSGSPIYLDGSFTGDTYFEEVSANEMRIVAGGNERLRAVGASGVQITGALTVPTGTPIYLDGSFAGDTYWFENGANTPSLVVGGTQRLQVIAAGVRSFGTTGIGYYADSGGTNTGTAVVRNGTDGYLYLTSSSRRFKENISTALVTDAQLDAFMTVMPSWWDYTGQKNGALGFIAEDLAALPMDRYGFNPLVNYGGDGQIESNRDYALIAMHHLVIQRLERKIAALEARIH